MAIQKPMKDELFKFVSTLAEEDIDKLVNHLPELISSLGESSPPYPQEPPRRSA